MMIGWGLHYLCNSLQIASRLPNPSWFFDADNKDFAYKIYIDVLYRLFFCQNDDIIRFSNAAKEFRIVENVLWTRKQHLSSTSQASNFIDSIISQEIVDVNFYLWMRKQKYLKINLVTNFLVKIQHVKHLLAINFGG